MRPPSPQFSFSLNNESANKFDFQQYAAQNPVQAVHRHQQESSQLLFNQQAKQPLLQPFQVSAKQENEKQDLQKVGTSNDQNVQRIVSFTDSAELETARARIRALEAELLTARLAKYSAQNQTAAQQLLEQQLRSEKQLSDLKRQFQRKMASYVEKVGQEQQQSQKVLDDVRTENQRLRARLSGTAAFAKETGELGFQNEQLRKQLFQANSDSETLKNQISKYATEIQALQNAQLVQEDQVLQYKFQLQQVMQEKQYLQQKLSVANEQLEQAARQISNLRIELHDLQQRNQQEHYDTQQSATQRLKVVSAEDVPPHQQAFEAQFHAQHGQTFEVQNQKPNLPLFCNTTDFHTSVNQPKAQMQLGTEPADNACKCAVGNQSKMMENQVENIAVLEQAQEQQVRSRSHSRSTSHSRSRSRSHSPSKHFSRLLGVDMHFCRALRFIARLRPQLLERVPRDTIDKLQNGQDVVFAADEYDNIIFYYDEFIVDKSLKIQSKNGGHAIIASNKRISGCLLIFQLRLPINTLVVDNLNVKQCYLNCLARDVDLHANRALEVVDAEHCCKLQSIIVADQNCQIACSETCRIIAGVH